MPTSFCRGPPFSACVPAGSAYSESRHSVPYADFGIRHNVVIIRELVVADCANAALFGDFSLQKFSHFSEGSEFPIPPRMMRIINASNTRLQSARIMRLFAATTPA
jgi:hypothetical protein